MTYDDAIAALATAKASGDVAAIIAAAEALAVTAAAPKPKATRKPRAPKDDRPAWFTAVAKTRRGVAKIKHSLAVTFADGQSVRVNAWQAEAGKPIAVGHALAVAIEFIRQRRGSDAGFRAPVPAIESAQLVAGPNDGESFDGAECSRLTETMRARIEPDARPVDTLASLITRRQWLAEELARREAALARVQSGPEPERYSPEERWAVALAEAVAGGRRLDARIDAKGGAVAQLEGEPCEAPETGDRPVVATSDASARETHAGASPARNLHDGGQGAHPCALLIRRDAVEPIEVGARHLPPTIFAGREHEPDVGRIAEPRESFAFGPCHETAFGDRAHGLALYQGWPPWLSPPVGAWCRGMQAAPRDEQDAEEATTFAGAGHRHFELG